MTTETEKSEVIESRGQPGSVCFAVLAKQQGQFGCHISLNLQDMVNVFLNDMAEVISLRDSCQRILDRAMELDEVPEGVKQHIRNYESLSALTRRLEKQP